jgi:uncharacterized protein YndB with AHSA1/START domain
MLHVSTFLLLVFAQSAVTSDIATMEYRAGDTGRVLRQVAVVNAPLRDVWSVFTTSEGWESWAVPFAQVDFRVGGLIETSYDLAAKRGDPVNIHNRILSFLPYRMLSIQAVQAPPGFPYADLLPTLHSVLEFEAVDDQRTRVTISGVGYRAGEGYDALLNFFRKGNAWTFARLAQRFEAGPVDGSEELPSVTPDTEGDPDRTPVNKEN